MIFRALTAIRSAAGRDRDAGQQCRLFGLVLFSIVALSGCSDSSPEKPKLTTSAESTSEPHSSDLTATDFVPPPTDNYVGSAACRRCHPDISADYAAHPMANSLKPITTDFANELPTGHVGNRHRFLSSTAEVGALVHAETMIDNDGDTIWHQPFTMDYVVGSGQRAYAFLYTDHDMLFQSPLNWYATTEDWSLSPGYVTNDPRRFRRRATDECLACHAGRIHAMGRNLNRYDSPIFQEAAIGCENCHGPGADHIRFHDRTLTDRTANSRTDPIVNPSALPAKKRDAVCFQCHLQATARVLRPGRSHLDFRPGMHLSEIWTPVEATENDGKAVRHVQQMRSSRCYEASGEQLTCITCHDPHRRPAENNRIAFYRQRCYGCHDSVSCEAPSTDRASQQDSCIACHMPSATSRNVAHVSQTDHRIPRRPTSLAEPDRDKKNSDDVVVQYFDQIDLHLSQWEVDRGLGIALWSHADVAGQQAPDVTAQLLEPTLSHAPHDHFAPSLLAAFYRQRGQLQKSQQYFRIAESLPAGQESAWEGLLVTFYLQQDWTQALSYADRSLELLPGEARFHALRADILLNLERPEEAIAAGYRSIELDPTVLPVRQWLEMALRNAGRTEDADVQVDVIRRMQNTDAAGDGPIRQDAAAGTAKEST